MSGWNWTPGRDEGIWRYGSAWMRPFGAAVPWLTLGVLVLMLLAMSGRMTMAKGTLFDLPRTTVGEGETASLVALAIPVPRATLVFFDDARYALDSDMSTAALSDHLAARAANVPRKTLLVLADRRVACGDLMRLAEAARGAGVERVLFAENGETEEPGR